MELTTVRKEDVPEYLRHSEFFLALDDGAEQEFSIPITHFKTDTVVTDKNSFRNLLNTLRFWGVGAIHDSIFDIAFDSDCSYFTPVAADFKIELRYLDELIQLRTLTMESRLEHACGYGNLQIVRKLVDGNSAAINKECLEAAASGGHLHVIKFLHSFEGRKHWICINEVSAAQGHVSCVQYVFKHTKSFINAAYIAAKQGHVNILYLITKHGGQLETALYEAGLYHLEVVQFLFEQNVSPWPYNYSLHLVAANVLPVLRFALSRGCDVHPLTLCNARSVECVQILVDVGDYQLDEHSTALAAEAGLEVLKYVHTQGCPLTIHTTLRAVQHNQLEVLKYLHAQHCPWNGQCIRKAEKYGSYECLVYLYEQGCDVPYFYKDYFLNPFRRSGIVSVWLICEVNSTSRRSALWAGALVTPYIPEILRRQYWISTLFRSLLRCASFNSCNVFFCTKRITLTQNSFQEKILKTVFFSHDKPVNGAPSAPGCVEKSGSSQINVCVLQP